MLREKSILYEALACTDTISLIDQYLQSSIDPNSTIRLNFSYYINNKIYLMYHAKFLFILYAFIYKR